MMETCGCEGKWCEEDGFHRAGACNLKPEMLVELLGHKVTLCFRCYVYQTVGLAPNEYKILETAQ